MMSQMLFSITFSKVMLKLNIHPKNKTKVRTDRVLETKISLTNDLLEPNVELKV